MPKTCYTENCNNNVFSNNRCLRCQHLRTDDKWLKSSKGKITPKVKESSLKPTTSKRIKPISDKKLEELKEYRLLRDAYMKNHDICEVKGCSRLAQDLHHKKPRAYYLCDTSIFMATCRQCHTKIESEDSWARENGYKLNHL